MDDDQILWLALLGLGAWWWWTNQNSAAETSGSDGTSVQADTGGVVVTVDLEAKVLQMAQAIAFAEGFYVPGSVPNRSHNPGDLGPGDTGYPGVFIDGSTVSQLPDDATGWAMLQNKLRNIFLGKSHVYSTTMTIEMMARKWAGNWQAWSNNVASKLGISTQTTIEQWLTKP